KRSTTPHPVPSGTTLTGVPGCPGEATGRARVILDPADPRTLEPGDVLIAPLTDPSWTPLFVPAEAVVVDVGAQMSHAVIVSRELGIPAVVSVTGATGCIPDGALVEVDGDLGLVRVLEAWPSLLGPLPVPDTEKRPNRRITRRGDRTRGAGCRWRCGRCGRCRRGRRRGPRGCRCR